MIGNKLLVGISAFSVATAASAAAAVPLGQPLGVNLGVVLGFVLGTSLGPLPLAHVGLLIVAAASLLVGIALVRRKRH